MRNACPTPGFCSVVFDCFGELFSNPETVNPVPVLTVNQVIGMDRCKLVGRLGFEPRTNRLKAWCSTN